MTRLFERVRGGLATTLFIHVAETGLSAVIAGAAASSEDLRAATAADGFELLDALRDGVDEAKAVFFGALVACALWVTITPWLAAVWLAALAGPRSLPEAARLGISRGLASLATTLLIALVALIALAVVAAGPALTRVALADIPNVRSQDLVALLSIAPGLFLLACSLCWLDLSRGAVIAGYGPLQAVGAGFRRLSGGLFLLYGATTFGGATLAGVVFVLPSGWGLPATLAAGQALLFSRRLLRSVWLAAAAAAFQEPAPRPTADPRVADAADIVTR